MSDREKLKKLAEAATQVSLSVSKKDIFRIVMADFVETTVARTDCGMLNDSHNAANAAYIAAANPSTILALLAELEQAERERDESSAETAACLKFLSNSLHWEGFRLEMLTDKDDVKKVNAHEENVRLLTNYLAEKGHGIKFLAALRTLREASAWIPISERLPELHDVSIPRRSRSNPGETFDYKRSDWVLTIDMDKPLDGSESSIQSHWNIGRVICYPTSPLHRTPAFIHKCTHWRPLPEAPDALAGDSAQR